MGIDYYKVLKLSEGFTPDDLKRSYYKLSMRWHPDKNPLDKKKAELRFKQIAEAYEVKKIIFVQFIHLAAMCFPKVVYSSSNALVLAIDSSNIDSSLIFQPFRSCNYEAYKIKELIILLYVDW